jgi:rSAM/selenodomain-associated transferase 2
MSELNISIIIPTVNEAHYIEATVRQFTGHYKKDQLEVIVVDGSSDDHTVEIALAAGAITVENAPRNRAKQLNLGASHARYSVLYFVHADVQVPTSFFDDIVTSLSKGFQAGCYRSGFENYPGLMKLNAFVTRFYWLTARGGDQTLYISKQFFEDLKGYDETYCIMEDYDIVKRIWATDNTFLIIPKEAKISMRKYSNNSWIKVQYANALAMIMFGLDYPADQIKKKYQSILKPLSH